MIPTRCSFALAAAALLLVGCESGAAETARRLHEARAGCTEEKLRAGDEECVRMMERYVEMGSEAVETYLGALRSFDAALQRQQGLAWDTAGLGRAVTQRGEPDVGAAGGTWQPSDAPSFSLGPAGGARRGSDGYGDDPARGAAAREPRPRGPWRDPYGPGGYAEGAGGGYRGGAGYGPRYGAGHGHDPRYAPGFDPRYDPRYDPRADPRYGPGFDPRYDPRTDPRYAPSFDPRYDPRADPRYGPGVDPRYDPRLDPRYDPRFGPGYDPRYPPAGDPRFAAPYHPGYPPYDPRYPSPYDPRGAYGPQALPGESLHAEEEYDERWELRPDLTAGSARDPARTPPARGTLRPPEERLRRPEPRPRDSP